MQVAFLARRRQYTYSLFLSVSLSERPAKEVVHRQVVDDRTPFLQIIKVMRGESSPGQTVRISNGFIKVVQHAQSV